MKQFSVLISPSSSRVERIREEVPRGTRISLHASFLSKPKTGVCCVSCISENIGEGGWGDWTQKCFFLTQSCRVSEGGNQRVGLNKGCAFNKEEERDCLNVHECNKWKIPSFFLFIHSEQRGFLSLQSYTRKKYNLETLNATLFCYSISRNTRYPPPPLCDTLIGLSAEASFVESPRTVQPLWRRSVKKSQKNMSGMSEITTKWDRYPSPSFYLMEILINGVLAGIFVWRN